MFIRHAISTLVITAVILGSGAAIATAEAPTAIPAPVYTSNPVGDAIVAGGASAALGAVIGGAIGAGIGCGLTVPTGLLVPLTCPMGAIVGGLVGAPIGAVVMGSIGAGAMTLLDGPR